MEAEIRICQVNLSFIITFISNFPPFSTNFVANCNLSIQFPMVLLPETTLAFL